MSSGCTRGEREVHHPFYRVHACVYREPKIFTAFDARFMTWPNCSRPPLKSRASLQPNFIRIDMTGSILLRSVYPQCCDRHGGDDYGKSDWKAPKRARSKHRSLETTTTLSAYPTYLSLPSLFCFILQLSFFCIKLFYVNSRSIDKLRFTVDLCCALAFVFYHSSFIFLADLACIY